MEKLNSLQEVENFIENNPAALLYISAPSCNVCDILKERIENVLGERFPKMKMAEANVAEIPELSAKFNVFSAPTFMIYFDKKEFAREGRNVGLYPLSEKLEKIYNLFFN
ncbi:MAG: thioredoxin family protein [Epsilonproteobacteria bacterium]|nr:thioredoxin family protein [Campylobacterota bacterium]